MESIQPLRPRQLEILQPLATELSICIWDLVTDPESAPSWASVSSSVKGHG